MERKKFGVATKMKTRRSEINLTSVLVTIVFLSCALVTADITFTTRIKGISQDLSRALSKVLELDGVIYTNITDNATYVSDVQYNPKGMAGLYNITHWFMDLIQPKEVFPEDVQLTDEHDNIEVSKIIEKWPSLLKHYAGLLSLTIIGILFAVMMPLIGFIFCCCRCCGNCGARSQPFDKKHDMCKKICLAILLIGIATLILFGVVCAFVSNQHMQEGVEELPNSLRDSLKDVKTYINTTNLQIDTLLNKNFDELQTTMFKILNESDQIISKQLEEYSNATSFTNLQTFVEGLAEISEELNDMKAITVDLRIKASQLNDGLRRVRHELLHSLQQCTRDFCKDIYNQISNLTTDIDFDNLPDVKEQIDTLGDAITPELRLQINATSQSFANISIVIKQEVQNVLPKIQDSIQEAGKSLKNANSDINKMLKKIVNMIDTKSNHPIDQAEEYIEKYSIYRYYAGLFVSSMLLLVIVCVTFGLMCGICGKRPDGYDDDCCNKGAGSRFLMLGVAIMFVFSIVLMIVTLAYFLTGVVVQRLACDTLRNPNDSRVFSLLEKSFDFESIVKTDIGCVIRSCHQKNSAYKVLHLEDKLDVEEIPNYLEKFKIDEKIKEFEGKFDDINTDITQLDEETIKKIEELKHSPINDFNLDRFGEILDKNLTSINLSDLAQQLGQLYKKLMKYEDEEPEVKMSIKQNQMYLEMYHNNLVVPMNASAFELKNKAENIKQKLNFGHANFSVAIDTTLNEVQQAQDFITNEGPKTLRNITIDFGTSFRRIIVQYLYRVSNATLKDVGKCEPVSNVYNATLIATCDKILNPWNGFWLSVGWCLVLFIPTIILSVKLSTLYQKSDPYPGPLVEHEYLYDAYADRDNIPLSNTSSKKGKKKKKKKTRGGEMGVYESRGYHSAPGGEGGPSRGGGGPPESRTAPPLERDAPGGSTHPDTRYADMAPKHWEDFPNGGPPQYQTAAPMATEYERPPPYYYPGPGDRP